MLIIWSILETPEKKETEKQENADHIVHMRQTPQKRAAEKLMNAECIVHIRNTPKKKEL